jgi:hypothetical protein
VARLEYKQRSSSYAAAALSPAAVASRRAQSAKLHSSHQRSLLDLASFSQRPTPARPGGAGGLSVEAALQGLEGLTFVEEEGSDGSDDDGGGEGGGGGGEGEDGGNAVFDLDAHVSFAPPAEGPAVGSPEATRPFGGDAAVALPSAAAAVALLEAGGFGAAWRHFSGCKLGPQDLRDDAAAVATAGYFEYTDQVIGATLIQYTSCNSKSFLTLTLTSTLNPSTPSLLP